MATMKKEELEQFLRDNADSPMAVSIKEQLAAMEGTKPPVVSPTPTPVVNRPVVPAPVYRAPVYTPAPVQERYVVVHRPVKTFPPMDPAFEDLLTTMNFTQRDNYFREKPWQSREFYRKYPQLQYGSFGILGKSICKFFGK